MKTVLNLLAVRLLSRMAERRQKLSHDTVAQALEELADICAEVMRLLPEDEDREEILTHVRNVRAHSSDNLARELVAPPATSQIQG